MADKKSIKELHDEHRADNLEQYRKWREVAPPVNWRAWGSWYGWGTPIGLGLFFVLCAFAVWILFHLG